MAYILTCGCKSQYGGFPSEWDSESRECEPAVSYGSLCEKHFSEYEARPAQFELRKLSDSEILDIWYEHNNGSSNWTEYINFARAILKKASEK